MEKEILNLPLLIGGEEIYGEERMRLEYDDLIIDYPVLNDSIREKILAMDQDSIHDLELNDIVAFLQKVSLLWHDPDYEGRRKLIGYGPRISGQTAEMYTHNIGVVLQMISFKNYMVDTVEFELGDKRILDEWISKENAEIHAEPLGRMLHIISGNVALVGFYSIVRGLMTKNVNIVKLSQKDFLSSYLFIKSFYDVDPEHPVTKAVSAVYWNKDDMENIGYFTAAANGMVVWGGHDTITAYKKNCPVGCEFIEYGPKKGIQIIDNTEGTDLQLAYNVARDVSVFDQEACLSPQMIFVKGGDIRRFCFMIFKGLMDYNHLWPASRHPSDHYIQMNYLLRSHEYLGNLALTDDERKFMVVLLNDDTELNFEHPLGRTIFVRAIDDFDECLPYIDGYVQTVGIAPKSLARELRDRLTRRGVTRISNIGEVEMPREGLVHEGISMARFVRIVGMDKEPDYYAKRYDVPDGYFHQFIYTITALRKGDRK